MEKFMKDRERFLKIAEELRPELIHTVAGDPVTLAEDAVSGQGKSIVYDFGNHFTGYFSVKVSTEGHHPDAPAWLRVTFAEVKDELKEDPEGYRGWIAKSWIQTEQVHIDQFPTILKFPRRYAFRYVRIEQLSESGRYSLIFSNPVIDAVSSAREENLTLADLPEKEENLDRIAVRTLHECMQEVFEDGAKRDRRLWIGDLRLEALADYQTYHDTNLVRRCLYLFAGTLLPDGHVASNVFPGGKNAEGIYTKPEADDAWMYDYSLLFVPALRDYVKETGDMETLCNLYPVAEKQIELAETGMEDGIVIDHDQPGWCFIDWTLDLDRQAAAQGVYLYCLMALEDLTELKGDSRKTQEIHQKYEKTRERANQYFFDKNQGLYVSGQDRQLSCASQIWMILGGAADKARSARILENVSARTDVIRPVNPYLYHSLVEAWDRADRRDMAEKVLLDYWGGMADLGADTFWELYDPKDPGTSPYGGKIVHSWCHAWSCAPAYFLRIWKKKAGM